MIELSPHPGILSTHPYTYNLTNPPGAKTDMPRVDSRHVGLNISVQSVTSQTTSTTIPGTTYCYGERRASATGGTVAIPLVMVKFRNNSSIHRLSGNVKRRYRPCNKQDTHASTPKDSGGHIPGLLIPCSMSCGDC